MPDSFLLYTHTGATCKASSANPGGVNLDVLDSGCIMAEKSGCKPAQQQSVETSRGKMDWTLVTDPQDAKDALPCRLEVRVAAYSLTS